MPMNPTPAGLQQSPGFPGSWQSQTFGQQGGAAEMQNHGLSPSARPTSGLPAYGNPPSIYQPPSYQPFTSGPQSQFSPMMDHPYQPQYHTSKEPGGGNQQQQQQGANQSYLGGTNGVGDGNYLHGHHNNVPMNSPWGQQDMNNDYQSWGDPYSFLNPWHMFGGGSHIGFSTQFNAVPNMAPNPTPIGFSQGYQSSPMGLNPYSSLNRSGTQPYSFLGVQTSA